MKYATEEELENNDIDLGDCDPHYAEKMQRKQACATEFTRLLDKNFPTKGFVVNGQTLKDDMENFKKTCNLTFELNEAFKARAAALLRRIQEFKETDEGKACQAEVPRLIAELRSTGFTQRFNDALKKHIDTCPPLSKEENDLLMTSIGESNKTIQNHDFTNDCKNKWTFIIDNIENNTTWADFQRNNVETGMLGITRNLLVEYKKECPYGDDKQKEMTEAIRKAHERVMGDKKKTIEDALGFKNKAEEEHKAERYAEAFRLYKQYAAAMEKIVGKPDDNVKSYLEGTYVGLSFHALFAKEFQATIDAANRAIELDPADLAPQTNRAHALMFLGRTGEARALYLAHRGEKIDEHDWNYYILDDFKQLRAAGLTHPLMAKIESELADSTQGPVGSTSDRKPTALPESQGERSNVIELQRRVRSFIDEYHRVAASDMQHLGKFYADTVDYGHKGLTPRGVIMREKMEVVQMCAERSYRVLDDSLRIRQTGADRVDVEFEVDTICRGGRRKTQRIWQNFISLDLSKGSPVIVAQRGSTKQAE